MSRTARILHIVVAAFMLVAIVAAGWKAAIEGTVGWITGFGVLSAVLGSACVELVGRAFDKSASTLEALAGVPRIEEMVREAHSVQEQVRLLERERLRMEEIIRAEATREALRDREKRLLDTARQCLRDLDSTRIELARIGEAVDGTVASREVAALRTRLRTSGPRTTTVTASLGGMRLQVPLDPFLITPEFLSGLIIAFSRALNGVILDVTKIIARILTPPRGRK